MTTPAITRPPIAARRAVPIDKLKDAIVAVLEQYGPNPATNVALGVGYSDAPVRKRLTELEEENRVHRVRHNVHTNLNGSVLFLWCAGPFVPTEAALVPPPKRAARGELAGKAVDPSQATRKKYPPINRRAPLVSALFGPARQEAA